MINTPVGLNNPNIGRELVGERENNPIQDSTDESGILTPETVVALIELKEATYPKDYVEARDRELGESRALLFHNGSLNTLEEIIQSGKVASHSTILSEGGTVNYRTASNNHISDVRLTPEGLYYQQKGKKLYISYADYVEDEEIKVQFTNDPFAEVDEIFLSENAAYYDTSGWALVFPKREIVRQFQYSVDPGDIRIYSKRYRTRDTSQQFQIDGSQGAEIDLETIPYLIVIDSSKRKEVMELLKKAYNNSHPGNTDNNFSYWIGKHVFFVDTLDVRKGGRNNNESISVELFTRFDIPIYRGKQKPTGNIGLNIYGEPNIYLYNYEVDEDTA